MYTSEFEEIGDRQIAKAIQDKGYFIFENALIEPYIDDLLEEINFNNILVNTNDVGIVFSGCQRFLTHCLAKSKKTYDLITSRRILNICNEYFNDRYQLTNHRICQTLKTVGMPWHTDNNLQIENRLSGKHNMQGILFLFYLSNVEMSPFQYIKDSHNWSQNYDEIYFSDSWIDSNYQKDILTFKMKKGGFIACNIHGIHRAKPFQDRNHTRTILLFQVDRLGSEHIGHGEQNLINTEYIDNLSPELSSYLGFGIKRNYPAFPNSSVATMELQDILSLQSQLLPQFTTAFVKKIIKTLLPQKLIVNAKRMGWHLNKFKRSK
jgi:hypothetical protein